VNLEEFKKNYMGENCKWNFNLFDIICKKCKSNIVEFNGYAESEGGYYGEHSLTGFIVVKCHNCGNAFKIDDFASDDVLLFNTDGDEIRKYHEETI